MPVDNRKYYIGSRKSAVKPENDINYMGSSKYLTNHINIYGMDNFKKEILSLWDNVIDLLIEENRIHTVYDVAKNEEFYNVVIQPPPSVSLNSSFYVYCGTHGLTTVVDVTTGEKLMVSVEEYRTNEKYVSITTNTVNVINKLTGEKETISKDDFDPEKHLFHTKNRVVVRNKLTGDISSISKEEFTNEKDKLYEYIHKNTVVARNIKTGEKKRIPVQLFRESDDWISLNIENGLAKIIHIFDSNDVLQKVYNGTFDTLCRKDGLPYAELAKSYKSGGKYKLYVDSIKRACSYSRLVNSGSIKYLGWYAKVIN
jgi:hypothetical protein